MVSLHVRGPVDAKERRVPERTATQKKTHCRLQNQQILVVEMSSSVLLPRRRESIIIPISLTLNWKTLENLHSTVTSEISMFFISCSYSTGTKCPLVDTCNYEF